MAVLRERKLSGEETTSKICIIAEMQKTHMIVALVLLEKTESRQISIAVPGSGR